MNSFYNTNKSDEYFTPRVLVEPIFEFIKPNTTIYCPFDTEKSEFVLRGQETNEVIYSHISYGQDFFAESIPPCDFVISNPPFSRKLDVLKKLYDSNVPFAMLLGVQILNYQEIGEFFLDKEVELLLFDKRVSYDGHPTSFGSCYFCHNVLPEKLIFRHLESTNTGKNFVPSHMYEG